MTATFVLTIISTLYLLVVFGIETYRVLTKRLGVLYYIATLVLILILAGTLYTYYHGFAPWQGAVFALGYMLLGLIPDLYQIRTRQTMNLPLHAARFMWHVMLVVYIYFSS